MSLNSPLIDRPNDAAIDAIAINHTPIKPSPLSQPSGNTTTDNTINNIIDNPSSIPSSSSSSSSASPSSPPSIASCLRGPRCLQCCRAGFYLSVAIGGRRNCMFQEDNLTAINAPESLLTKQIREQLAANKNLLLDNLVANGIGMQSQFKSIQWNANHPHHDNNNNTQNNNNPSTTATASHQQQDMHRDGDGDAEEENPAMDLSSSITLPLSDDHPPSSSNAMIEEPHNNTISSVGEASSSSVPSSNIRCSYQSPSRTSEKRAKKMRIDNCTANNSESEETHEEDYSDKENTSPGASLFPMTPIKGASSSSGSGSSPSVRISKSLSTPFKYHPESWIDVEGQTVAIRSFEGMPISAIGNFGQDAYYIACDQVMNSNEEPTLFLSMGIADGVGGWRSSGVDSGVMARTMMNTCLSIARDRIAYGNDYIKHFYHGTAGGEEELEHDGDVMRSPGHLLTRAYHQVKRSNTVSAGSTTACVVNILPACIYQQLHSQPSSADADHHDNINNQIKQEGGSIEGGGGNQENQLIHLSTTPANKSVELIHREPSHVHDSNYCFMSTANLGDSGYTVFRNANTAIKCKFQREDTGIVKQLAVIPMEIQNSHEAYEYCNDSPDEASLATHRIEVNDIIIIASDGLWDNLHEEFLTVSYPFGFLRLKASSQVNDDRRVQLMQRVIRKIIKNIINEENKQQQQTNNNGEEGKKNQEDNHIEEEKFDDDDEDEDGSNAHLSIGRPIDVKKICAGLVQHAANYMNKPEGKPDDLTVIVAQLRRQVDEPCACQCHQHNNNNNNNNNAKTS